MMQALEKIKAYIDELEEATFYKYLAGFICTVALVVALMMVQYYRNSHSLKKQLSQINESREEARTILTKNEKVEQQRKRVNEILEEHEDFKIQQFFEEELLKKLGLSNKFKKQKPSIVDRDESYREVLLEAKLDNMNMKDVCELLEKIEQQEIVYTKKLELTKARKMPPSLEVAITIATLQSKQQETEFVE